MGRRAPPRLGRLRRLTPVAGERRRPAEAGLPRGAKESRTPDLFHASTAGTIRKIRDGNGGTLGAPIWQYSVTNGLTNGEPDRLLGDAVYRDSNIASMASNARIIAYADWSAYYIRTVGDIVVERSDDYAFNRDMTTLRCKWRVDGDLIDYGAGVTMVQNV